MTLQHEADSDGLHLVEGMTDTTHYTVHTEADQQGTPDIHRAHTSCYPNQPVPNAIMSDGCKGRQ